MITEAIKEICDAIDEALANETDSPYMIVLDTIKGCGIDFMEDNYTWRYGAIDDALFEKFNKELEEDYKARCARAEKEGK